MDGFGKLSEQYKASIGADQTRINAALTEFAKSLPHPSVGLPRLAKKYRSMEHSTHCSPLAKYAGTERLAAGSSHFLSPAFTWFRPTEPQATSAFVALLTAGNRDTRLARGKALLEAARKGHSLENAYPEDGGCRQIPDNAV